MSQITFWDNIEGSRMIQDVVIQREFAAGEVERLTTGSNWTMRGKNLGIRSTLADLSPVQEAFLTSAAALVKSSAEIFPAQ